MSIAVNLERGPFSQIGLEIVSLATAYQLATGAYGWWKARERSQSLTELLSVSGGELVSTSSFNLSKYRQIRTHHSMVQGVVVQGHEVQRTKLPKASTAIPDHPGTACLRALAAGLMCLFTLDTTVEILQDLIPFALVQFHQEDTAMQLDGPLLASLKHWVSAIMAEEDSDMFRDYMQKKIMLEQSKLTGIPVNEITDLEYKDFNEIRFVIGVLRWILTPWHKRGTKNYPTRSLKAWTIALVLESLGFEVQLENTVFRRNESHDICLPNSHRGKEAACVFLVVDDHVDTDPTTPIMHVPRTQDSPRPQITMIRGIPWMAFRHLRGSAEINTQFLTDVWKVSFTGAKKCFRSISMHHQNIHIDIAAPGLDEVAEHHKNLLLEFSPHLGIICEPGLRHFVPMSSHSPGWGLAEIKEQLRIIRTPEELANPKSPCRANCYTLLAIICGAIYGLCSEACFDNGNVLSEDSEVAFTPGVLYDGGGRRLKEWARIVGISLMLGHQASLTQWNELLFEMFLGKDTQSGSLLITARNNYINQQNPYRNRLLLGAQANGLAMLSDILVNPSAQVESFVYVHIQRGQILSFPLSEDQYIQASSYNELASTLDLDPDPRNDTLCRFDGEYLESAMRVDVEPCWEEDPRTVSFVVRRQGIPIASLNISAFLDNITYGQVPCVCSNPLWEVSVPLYERWQHVSLYQLQRRTIKGMSFKRADVNYADNRILVDASQSAAATIYAACSLHVRDLWVASECLTCAHKRAMDSVQNGSVVVLIPHRRISS